MKKYSKLGFYMLFIGWFPFMFLSVGAKHLPETWQIVICMVGFLLCIFGGFTVMVFFQDVKWWASKEELDELYKKTLDEQNRSIDIIEAVKIIAVKKAGFSKDEIENQIKKMNR